MNLHDRKSILEALRNKIITVRTAVKLLGQLKNVEKIRKNTQTAA